MFKDCHSLISLDLTGFITSNRLVDLCDMFWNCYSLISLNLSSFDTSEVTNLGHIFYNCRSLTSIDISSFNTEKVGRRYALVCFESEDSAIKAKEKLEGKNVCGYNLLCKLIKDKSNNMEYQYKKNHNKPISNKRFFQKPKPGFFNSEQNMCNLHIKNIPFQIKERLLRR